MTVRERLVTDLRRGKPWADVPCSETADSVLDRLWGAVQINCSCGGKPDDDAGVCLACKLWHEACGRYDL